MSELVLILDPLDPKEEPAPAPRVRAREPGPRPDWLRVRYHRNETFHALTALKEGLGLVTGVRGGPLPQHRRVLERRHGDLHVDG
jgi:hypothetical protein